MNARSIHLKDDRLFECYVAERSGESLDPRAADHLADCPACVTRYDDLVAFMDDLRDEADAEIDELFPADRLLSQQQQILERLEHVNRSARVISFPARDAGGHARSTVRLTPRWLAAAAAAGLFIGVAVGGYLGPTRLHPVAARQQAQAGPSMTVQPSAPPAAVRISTTQTDAPDDDAFLMELELALARPNTRELQSFDAMTPHVRDIDVRQR